MKKIAVFVDVQNVYYTTKERYNRNFDYNAFWKLISKDCEIVKAVAYAIDKHDEKQKQFQHILKSIGFEIKLKPYIQRNDGSAKGDWDVGITLDVMEYSKTADKVILVSGDGDFDLLAEKVKRDFSVEFDVYGVPTLTAQSLIDAASKYIPIKENLLMNQK